MRLSKNLMRQEMACSCGCGFDTVDAFLVDVLQDITDYFGKEYKESAKLIITGGNRCKSHNDALRKQGVHTSPRSQHLYGRAADFKIFIGKEQVQPRDISLMLNEQWGDEICIGIYSNRLHVDTRTNGGKRWQHLT
jgi:uncharacterized protein YcbK (DUF882 family)